MPLDRLKWMDYKCQQDNNGRGIVSTGLVLGLLDVLLVDYDLYSQYYLYTLNNTLLQQSTACFCLKRRTSRVMIDQSHDNKKIVVLQ